VWYLDSLLNAGSNDIQFVEFWKIWLNLRRVCGRRRRLENSSAVCNFLGFVPPVLHVGACVAVWLAELPLAVPYVCLTRWCVRANTLMKRCVSFCLAGCWLCCLRVLLIGSHCFDCLRVCLTCLVCMPPCISETVSFEVQNGIVWSDLRALSNGSGFSDLIQIIYFPSISFNNSIVFAYFVKCIKNSKMIQINSNFFS
jgi:hypothetical protein